MGFPRFPHLVVLLYQSVSPFFSQLQVVCPPGHTRAYPPPTTIHKQTRLWAGASTVEVGWTIGPLPCTGMEVVLRYRSDLQSNDTWFTDANGRSVMQRTRNRRPSYPTSLAEPVAGNYYPITTGIHIQEPGRELTVSVDRACGEHVTRM